MPGTLEAEKRVLARSATKLERPRKELQDLVARWVTEADPAGLVDDMKIQKRMLQQDWEAFEDEVKNFIKQMTDDNDAAAYDADLQQWDDLEYNCQRLIARANGLLEKEVSRAVQQQPNPNLPPGSSSQVDTQQQQTITDNINRVLQVMERREAERHHAGQDPANAQSITARLPKMELPKFKGNPLDWTTFWDRFDASIGQNTKLAAVDKLNYLMGQLEGDPSKMIKSLPITNNSYDVAVAMLKSRYGDKKMLISLLYRKLNDLKQVKNEVTALKRFVAEIDCMLGTLSTLGEDADDANFVTMILSKMPRIVVIMLEMFKPVNDPWTVPLLREKINEHIVKIDRATQVSSNVGEGSGEGFENSGEGLYAGEGRKGKWKKGKNGNRSDKEGSEAGQGSAKGKGSPKPGGFGKIKCALCDKNHWADLCTTYKTSDDRFERTKERNLCRVCLRSGHTKTDCLSTRPCFYCKATKNHNSALCFQKFGREVGEAAAHAGEKGEEGKSSGHEDSENEAGMLAAGEQVTLQIAKVQASKSFAKNDSRLKTRVLLDPGACRSYCSLKLAKDLGLVLKKGPSLTVNRFGSDEPIILPTKQAEVYLKDADGKNFKITVSVIEKITGEISRKPVSSAKLDYLKRKVKLADEIPDRPEVGPIDLLIGSDYYLDVITGEKIEVQEGLYLLGSKFGYILTGRSARKVRDEIEMGMCGFTCGNLRGLNDLVALPKADTRSLKEAEMSDYWSLEGIGIKDKVDESEDAKAVERFEKEVKYEDERYSVALPWNDKVHLLQSDYNLSIGRLNSLVRKLKENDDLFKTYSRTIDDQVKKGVIEKVEPSLTRGSVVHYIPHHAVVLVTPQKETTKVRIVYDGSARSKDTTPSLNECLYRGPVLLEDLVGQLIRFRTHEIAIISDIEKAFLQIGINTDDRDALRFLWLKNPDEKKVEQNVQVYRFCRVLFGLNCSPSLLALTIRHHLEQIGSAISRKVLDGLYVDNVIAGTKTVVEAEVYYREVKEMFKKASMNMRQWASNSQKFDKRIPDSDRVKSDTAKVLGIKWERKKDVISIEAGRHEGRPSTKREMLSALSKIYDPLGLFLPVTVPGKCLFQKLCQEKQAWDTEMCEEKVNKWKEQTRSLEEISNIRLPRKTSAEGSVSLIAFCDASSSCYATTVYLRDEQKSRVEVNLILSKGRLNPSRKLTIPKMELLAILIGTRALKFVKGQLHRPVQGMVLFSDSKCALFWVKSGKAPDTFSKNRLEEICKNEDVAFRYVKTDENPADWATRGKKATELTDFWWKGPNWLHKEESSWPRWGCEDFTPSKTVTKERPVHEASLLSDEKDRNRPPPLPINIERFSSYMKLLRVTAYCLRFVQGLKREVKESGPINAAEIRKAKEMWEINAQRTEFSDVFERLERGQKHPLMSLKAFVDKAGILRIQGRIGNANMNWDQKCPKLLPKGHPYTRLLIWFIHAKNGHAKGQHLLNLVRNEHWIAKGRSFVDSVTRGCATCKKASGKPYAIPDMPELPRKRVSPSPCFTHMGVDYFGPVKIKSNEGTYKAWVCLFTCLCTRAVHLEVADSLSAEDFLLCLRAFIARRGSPATMLSDNGPQFKATSEVLTDVWSEVVHDEDVLNFAAKNGIKWSFIPAFAPYMGGVYERLVGIVKQSLRKTIGKALLTKKELQVLVSEAEAIVNSRPLTYVNSDASAPEVLTPSHFLNPERAIVTPDVSDDNGAYNALGTTADDLIEKWKKGQALLHEFWMLWSGEYLDQLRSKNTYLHRHNSHLPEVPDTGDLVLVKEALLPRGSWRMAKIEDLVRSSDGLVRSAKVRVPSGRILHRPINLLVPFEFSGRQAEASETDKVEESKKSTVDENENSTRKDGRPQREAAAKAREKIRAQLQ